MRTTRTTGKRIRVFLMMLFVSLFWLAAVPQRTEAKECEVYYDVSRNGLQQGIKEAGSTSLQIDADLNKIAKQVVKNACFWSLKNAQAWTETMQQKTDHLKLWMNYSIAYTYENEGGIEAVPKRIASSVNAVAKYWSEYNLIGAATIQTKWDDGTVVYMSAIVLGKGECKPDTQSGTKTEILSSSYTVDLSDGAQTSKPSQTSKPAQPIKVTKIQLSKTSTTLLAGKKLNLKAVVSPTNAANKDLIWEVSNKKYASVSQTGVVTAKAAGAGKKVTVTAKAKDGSGKKATCTIKIKGAVKKITLKASKSVKAGKKLTVKATVSVGKNGSKALSWSVNNKKYASVSTKGVVTTKKAGKGKTITVTAKAKDGSGKKGSVKIKLK